MRGLSALLTLGALGVGFVAGRASLPAGPEAVVQSPNQPLARPLAVTLPGDPRELIPLVPGPGGEPGQQPGTPQPGPQQPPGQAPGQEGECTVLMFRDGQFYRLQPGQPQPGQGQPGQGQPGQPGQGQRGDGQPGADTDELFPLEPFGPGPGLPDLPGFPPSPPETPGLDLRV